MGQDMVYEVVPRLQRRVGDAVLANQNNATILLGRDRPGGVDSGYGSGPGAGAVHAIAGRANADDPSIADDSVTLYLSAKSDPDDNSGTTSVGTAVKGVPTAVLRADCVRIVPRRDFKLSVGSAYLIMQSDGTVVIEGNVSLGVGAAQRLIRGDLFNLAFAAHTHVSAAPGNPTSPPTAPLPDSLFSSKVLVF
jgi:hypothetical protein